MELTSTLRLNNGIEIPRFGLGVFKAQPGKETEEAVRVAIEHGYRAVDTAAYYKNESDVGRAIRAGIRAREDIFVTTKLWPDDFGYDAARRAFDVSMNALGLDVLDLYLLHWPREGLVAESWRALEAIYTEGRVRAIGISNFEPHHIDTLLETAKIKPTINQVELHPYLQQTEVRAYCARHEIAVESWSPIARGKVVDDEVISAIARRHGKSAVQVTIRRHLQQGIVTIPKSVQAQRIRENADVFDFELDSADMAAIDALDQGESGRIGPHPDTIDL